MKIELYWPNGQIKRRLHLKGGLRTGLDEMWSQEGALVDSNEYREGKLIENASKKTVQEKKAPVKIGSEKAILPSHKSKESNLYARNPHLFLMSKTWTPIETIFESLKAFSVGKADVIYVYGLGMGAPYFQLKKWLSEDPKRKLIFVEENEGYFAHFLNAPQRHFLINDPQVFLEWDRTLLAEKYPFENIEIVSIPSKKGALFRKFKLDLLKETTLSHALHVDKMHGYVLYQNFMKNLSHLPTSFYVNGLKNKFKGFPAIVCGAGPSLEKAVPLLKKLSSKALIIAGGSTMAALSSKGVPIHFGMAIDPNFEEYERFKNSFAFDTPLIYSTRVHPSIFQTCNGPFGYMQSGIGGPLELWMEESLDLTAHLVGESLPQESIAVTPVATAFAEFLGCSQILFCGVDLAYTDAKRYANGVVENKALCFSSLENEKIVSDRILRRKNYAGHVIHTATRWVMEAKSLSLFAKRNRRVEFYNTSAEGLPIKGVPYKKLSSFDFEKSLPPMDLPMMPKKTAEIVEKKKGELTSSLSRAFSCLEILAGKKKGSKVLAEIDLREELAFDLLFYDVEKVFEGASKWEDFLELCRKYISP